MKLNIFNILLPVVASILIMPFLANSVVFAWQKDGGATCQRVFASIKNESETRGWDGYVKANNVTKVSNSGTASPNQWVTVSWTPNAGFVGDVEAYVRIKKHNSNDTDDYKKVTGHLNCAPSPSPSPSHQPSPSPSPHSCDENEHEHEGHDSLNFFNVYASDNEHCSSPSPSPSPHASPSPSLSPSPSPSPSPSVSPSPSASPSPGDGCEGVSCNTGGASPSPSPSDPPSSTPSASPDPSPSTGGSSSNNSSSSSSGSNNNSGGQVLGAQTLASTGSNAPQIAIIFGLLMIGAGIWEIKRALASKSR